MHRSTPRARRTLLAAAVPVGLVLSGTLAWQSTHAAFSVTDRNADNSWQSGRVVLGTGGTGGALFAGPADGDLRPGSSRSRCIRVDYTGDVAAEVRVHVSTPTAAPSTLDPYLVMSVERGADVAAGAAVAPDCSSGFTPRTLVWNSARADTVAADPERTLADLKSRHHDFATGLPVAPTIAPGTHLTFRITYEVADDDAAQRAQSRATFTWEAHST
ncbi:hypothetical protein O2W14_15250 [Modestobacter sp. VKM Ac-2986]|uniref:hypothetical protein n=1 Tax=Modestobacter sp. VKM Ac-2986 TaxID=3004140 RepID=UPI0022AB5573|nr:hypothetical protein [Modestobacter sp. VKM Ac-2986]MCZ2830193.1 hypothetical protein [Modestobacter sp. VKM Ac-2986]